MRALTTHVLTSEQSRICDRRAVEELGIPTIVLMENAALSVVEVLEKHVGVESGQRVVVVCGRGNNGGDGLAVARHLHNMGVDVSVFLMARHEELKGDAVINCKAVMKAGVSLTEVTDEKMLLELEKTMRHAHVVVDALLGTGISGEVRGIIAGAIDALNSSAPRILSIDVPSGLDSDTGKLCGRCVRADVTVTLGAMKRGLLLFPGADMVGDLFLGSIGIPKAMFEAFEPWVKVTTEELVHKCYKTRASNTHKGDYGRVLVVGGSAGMSGAVMMCGVSALRGGAGLVMVALPKSLNNAFEASVMEVMSLPLPETEAISISLKALDVLVERMKWADVLAIGPGISRVDETQEFVRQLVRSSEKTVVLDADGIVAFANRMKELADRSCELVITPHPGEMAMLIGKSISEVQSDRIGITQAVAKELNATVVLKGAHTVIASPEGNTYINLTGNPGMASGGTGDVLTGLIASLIAQGNKPFEAAACAVFIHGLAGDIASWDKGEASLIAGDLIEYLPKALMQPDLWMPICLRPLSERVWFVCRGRNFKATPPIGS